MKRLRATIAGGLLGFMAIMFLWIPSFTTVRDAFQSSDRILLDRNGGPLQQIRVSFQERSLPWTPLAEISPQLTKAVIYAEDRRFYDHLGIDLWSIAGIGHSWLVPFAGAKQQMRGASTLTMQLVKVLHLVPEVTPRDHLTKRVTVKALQMIAAVLIELRWSKDSILETYLNVVSWRGEMRGVAAVSLGLFDKVPLRLGETDAALLAALLKFPSQKSERILQRACFLLRGISPPSDASDVHCDGERFGTDVLDRLNRKATLAYSLNGAPHFGLFVESLWTRKSDKNTPKNQVKTTIDGTLQERVHSILESRVSALAERNVKDGAALILNHRTGEVLAYIGHVGTNTTSSQVDGIQAHRQAGSTLKPFLYELAFEKRMLTPESLIDDRPFSIPGPRGSYRPENYDHLFHGLVPARIALASSLNIPAVKVGQLVGLTPFVNRLKDLGFTIEHDADWYGPAIALGTLDVSLWELVQAYGVLAEAGTRKNPILFATSEATRATAQSGRKIMSEDASWLVSHVISSAENRELSFGIDSPLSTSYWSAAKTGTSKDMRDNWCLGYSDTYVVGVWVGNYSGEPMWNVSGTSGAATAWADIMGVLHGDLTHVSAESPAPSGVVAMRDTAASMATLHFLAGTEPSAAEVEAAPDSSQTPHIDYPKDEMIIALDPDIPRGRERVAFEIVGYSEPLLLQLDGSSVPCRQKTCMWRPEKGEHELTLADASGKTLDAVRFVVK